MRRRLTYNEAIHIREQVRAGRMTTAQAARVYKLGQESVRRVVRGETYANPEWDEYGRGIAPEPTREEQEELDRKARASVEKLQAMLAEQEQVERGPSGLDYFTGKAKLPQEAARPMPDPYRESPEDLEADAALARLMGEASRARELDPDAIVEGLRELGEPPVQGRV
jgi:hypothetical protein